MRKKIVAGNWKMNKTPVEAIALSSELMRHLDGAKLNCEVVIAPTFLALQSVAEAIRNSHIKLAAQNCHYENDGAYTGEVSTAMLKSVGCEYVILGHSERRQYFGETDETVNRKVKKVLAEGMKVIMCVGETLEQRESNVTNQVIEKQVRGGLASVSLSDMANLVIAYEPVWAIGTGKNATSEQAEEVHLFIRGIVAGLYGQSVADDLCIQYGGSVKPSNAKELFSMPNIDGGLIGGASLKAEDFMGIVRSA
ncbi:MAG: triose-phosphate isomerase [Chlorobiales bacterium]|nr:triose-phosphate isomerase [Chlorobiales bacterium]